MKKILLVAALSSLLFITGCSTNKDDFTINEDGSKTYYEKVKVSEYSLDNKVTKEKPSNEVVKNFGDNLTITYNYEVKENENKEYDHTYKVNIKEKTVLEEGDRIIWVTNPDNLITKDSINKEEIDGIEYFVGKFTVEYDTVAGHVKKEETLSPTYITSSPSFRFYAPYLASNLNVTYEVTKQFYSFYLSTGNTAYYTIGIGSIYQGYLHS